jgi:hypothetical protein
MNKKLLIIGAVVGVGGVILMAGRKSDGRFGLPGLIEHESPNGTNHLPPAPAPAAHAPAPAPAPAPTPAPPPPVRRTQPISVGLDGAQFAEASRTRNPNWIDWR